MKNKKIRSAIAAALCLAVCASAVGMSGCGAKDSWNVSADGANVKAVLTRINDGYKLEITGKGDMASFSAPTDVPWFTKSDEIKEVSVGQGVSSIGAYAFAGIENSAPIVLPTSVTKVGSEFAPTSAEIFVFSENIDYGGDTPENVYVYREADVVTNDRYWQSDKSKGDIISPDDELFKDEGKYWRYDADDAPTKYVKKKVLFVGNSFTYRNGIVEHSSGVPGIFDNIAEDLGFAVETYSITGPGWYLENHAKSGDTCGKQVDKILNARDDFDYIVLQDQSTVAFENYNRFLNGIKAMQAKIEQTQKHAKIYLYETWGSPTSATQFKTTVPEMEKDLREAYTRAGAECKLDVSYIGKAFTAVYNSYKSINLYASDNRHQGYPGAYLSACVHVGNMLGGDVRKTTFVGRKNTARPSSTSKPFRHCAIPLTTSFSATSQTATKIRTFRPRTTANKNKSSKSHVGAGL